MAFQPIHLLNLTELKSRRGNSTDTTLATVIGLNYPPTEGFAIYIWNNTSIETADDNEIVQPTIGGITTGRWYRIDIGITYALLVAALGYIPYDSSNPNGYINNFTEADPTVPLYSKSLTTFSVIKNSTDVLYEPLFSKNTGFNKNFGTISGTVSEGNDIRIINGQTAFGWGNHSGLYPLLSGSYSNPSWISSLDYSKITGAPSIPSAQVNTDWNSTTGVSQLLNKPTIPTNNNQLINGNAYITANSFDILTNKSGNISQWSNDIGYLTSVPSQTFSSLTGKPTTISGYGITDFNSLGDSRWSALSHTHTFDSLITKPTTLSGYGITDAYPLLSNPSGYLTGITSGQITTALGFTPYNATNPSVYINQAGARTAISLTTTGIGAASYNSTTGVINIPTPEINDYTNTAVTAGGAGNAVFYLTHDKTPTGTALYTNITYVNPIVNDSNLNYSYSWSYNSTTKALTVNTKAAVGLNIALLSLTLLGVPSNIANGVNVQVLVKGN